MKKILLGLFLLLSGLSYAQTSNDVDAEAFITACDADPAGKLTYIQKVYITQLVEGLKSIGVWTKCKAIYPFVGGTAFKHKFNLKDPRDLDAAFRLVPRTTGTGFVTNDFYGIAGKYGAASSDAAFDTFIIPSTDLTNGNFGFAFYVTKDNSEGDVSFGNSNFSNTIQGIIRRNNTRLMLLTNSSSTTTTKTYSAISNQKGFHLAQISGSTLDYFFKGNKETQLSTSTSGSGSITTSLYIAGRNQGGGALSGSGKSYGFFSIQNQALTDTEAIQLSHLIRYSQTTLERQ